MAAGSPPAMVGPPAPPGWVPPSGADPAAPVRPWASTPLHHPYLPDPEASTRCYLRPTGPAKALMALAVVAALLSLATDSDAQLAVAVALAAGVFLDALTARRALTTLTLAAEGPHDAIAGRPTSWKVHLGGLRRPVTLTPTLLPRPPGVLVEESEPGLLTLPPAARGVVHHFFVDAHANGPIGLFEAGRRYRVTPAQPVPIGPGARRVDPDWPTPRAVGFGLSPVAPKGDDLFRSVRPYLRGDERRRIHWKSSAHHGELMVRESDGVGTVVLQVVVDLGPPGPGAEITAEVAAYVAEEALGRGWLVQLVTLDSGSVPPPLVQLGSPFGPPPLMGLRPPVHLETSAQRVHSATAVRHQLATAGHGTPQAPTWPGLSCVVTPGGIEWP